MSRESVACVTWKPRRTSLRRSSSWLVMASAATSCRIVLCRSCLLTEKIAVSRRGTATAPLCIKIQKSCINIQDAFCLFLQVFSQVCEPGREKSRKFREIAFCEKRNPFIVGYGNEKLC